MLILKKITNLSKLPFPLLLTADPSLERIKPYCKSSNIIIAKINEETVGVYVLKIKENTAEILNIAVEEKHQNKGVGKLLIQHAIEYCEKEKIKILKVGTGNSSISQIAFYQKCGFRIVGIIRDYFIENYEEEIFENGIQCRDMMRFEFHVP